MSLSVPFSFVTGRLRFTAVEKVAGPLIGACAASLNEGKSSLDDSAVFNAGVPVEE